MRAIAIEAFGGSEQLRSMELPRPRPAAGELLLRVVAAGVNPVDWKLRQGLLRDLLPHRFPLVPGWDVAGVVEEQGAGTSSFRKGDRVWAYARKPVVQWGCYAEYVSLPESQVAAMPARLLFEEAAAVPLAALTATQALFTRSGLPSGSTILIHGAAGGVGHFAVQLARHAGAHVAGTASSVNHPFVMGLGAEVVIDYTREDFAEALRRSHPGGVDVVLDTVGGPTLERSFALLRRGGRLVSIVEEPDPALAERHAITAHFIFVEPSAEQLGKLARLFDQKLLRAQVQKIHPLAQAAAAQETSAAGHVRGKLVLAL
jgi:NADPH2:quinone reductase